MSDDQYQIVFEGHLEPGFDEATVRANLGQLFKAPPARIEAMFSGASVVIKKGIDEATATKYLQVLKKSGATVRVVAPPEEPQPAAQEPAKAEITEREAAAQGDAANAPDDPAGRRPTATELAELARMVPERLARDAQGNPPPPPVAPELPLDEPGVELVAPSTPQTVEIDTSHLQVAELGADLSDPQTIEEPQYDLSGLSLAAADDPGDDQGQETFGLR